MSAGKLTFWVIERRDISPDGSPRYVSLEPGLPWTPNIAQALQFAREEDGAAYHRRYEARDPALTVVEHAWITPTGRKALEAGRG